MLSVFSDEHFMREALKEAQKAVEKDEVPVGAVLVHKNQIIARTYNLIETLNDVTAHAEMQIIGAGANYLNNKYLNECTLYVTLEPCVMCGGALKWSQIGKIVFGAQDPKGGYQAVNPAILHPKTGVVKGVLEKECADIIVQFFKKKRLNPF